MANYSKESCAAAARDMTLIIRDMTDNEAKLIKEFIKDVKKKQN